MVFVRNRIMALANLVFLFGRAGFVVRSDRCFRQIFCEQVFGNGLLDFVFITNTLKKPASTRDELFRCKQERWGFNEGRSLPSTYLGNLGENVREVVVDVSRDHTDDIRVQKSMVEKESKPYLP